MLPEGNEDNRPVSPHTPQYRGPKPERKNAAYQPEVLANGDTVLELLTRSRYLLSFTRDEWSQNQKERAGILFERCPLMEKAYNLVHWLRMIIKSKYLTKETARPHLDALCKDALNSSIDEFIATVQTIQSRKDEFLNYFVHRQTNAYSESFNAKIK